MNKYKCYHCGWCCGSNIDKYSSREEFDLAFEALKKLGIKLTGSQLENGMVLWPKPCPALKMTKKGSTCLIYDVRPYPCRQFLCGRKYKEDPRPFKSAYQYNMEYFNQLMEDPEFAKIKEKLENEAAKWGNAHGWKLERV
jgi:Fe-S-cluster containining protein